MNISRALVTALFRLLFIAFTPQSTTSGGLCKRSNRKFKRIIIGSCKILAFYDSLAAHYYTLYLVYVYMIVQFFVDVYTRPAGGRKIPVFYYSLVYTTCTMIHEAKGLVHILVGPGPPSFRRLMKRYMTVLLLVHGVVTFYVC